LSGLVYRFAFGPARGLKAYAVLSAGYIEVDTATRRPLGRTMTKVTDGWPFTTVDLEEKEKKVVGRWQTLVVDATNSYPSKGKALGTGAIAGDGGGCPATVRATWTMLSRGLCGRGGGDGQ